MITINKILIGVNHMKQPVVSEQTLARIKRLTEASGTSGDEGNIRHIMRQEMRDFVDDLEQDGLGGIFGVKESKDADAPRIMIAAHMDEVGFMVGKILENGLMTVVPLGGWNPYVVSAQRFTLHTRKGVYPIISSSIPPHLLRGGGKQATPDVSSILFDAGFTSKKEALAYGVRPGDTIVPESETILTANQECMIGKAWDNRYGCTLVLDMLEALQGESLPCTLIAGASVQEEVGLRGIGAAVRKWQPDLFIAVDCSPAGDIYGGKDQYGALGKGFLLRVHDPGMITLKRMRYFLEDVAETHDIPYQYFLSKGGTDAGAAHMLNTGIPSAVVGVCARYIHTHQSMFHLNDYVAAKEMIIHTVKSLDKDTVTKIIYD